METQKMEKWGTKLTIKFLKKYREHRCLWDFNDPEYKNRMARINALEDIVASMALNKFDVRSANVKIKALRSTYLHEKRKIRKSTKTGVSYRPKLAWYPLADSFLRNYVMEKFCLMGNMATEDEGQSALPKETLKQESNLDNAGLNVPHPSSTTTSQEQTPYTANIVSHQKIRRLSQQSQQQLNTGNSQQTITTPHSFTSTLHGTLTASPYTKKEKTITANQIQNAISNLGEIVENCHPTMGYSNTSNLAHSRDNDEFDAFGNSIAAQMRILPLDVAYEVQLQIQCLITQTKLKVLGRQTSIIVESNAASRNNWNQSVQHHNQSNINNYSNPCNNEVKMEKVDSEQSQNVTQTNNNDHVPELPNTNCYNLPDSMQDQEGTDVEDYLGLE